jgi:hypothetical protein
LDLDREEDHLRRVLVEDIRLQDVVVAQAHLTGMASQIQPVSR